VTVEITFVFGESLPLSVKLKYLVTITVKYGKGKDFSLPFLLKEKNGFISSYNRLCEIFAKV